MKDRGLAVKTVSSVTAANMSALRGVIIDIDISTHHVSILIDLAHDVL